MSDAPKLTDEQIRDMLDKATDGPWVLSGNIIEAPQASDHPFPWYVADAIEDCGPNGEETPHNARLIASAPDLARIALERGAERDAAIAALSAGSWVAGTAIAERDAAIAERDRLRAARGKLADAFDQVNGMQSHRILPAIWPLLCEMSRDEKSARAALKGEGEG